MYHPHHDRDHRSIICFPPEELSHTNVAIIRVMPSGRYTVHHIESNMQSGRWAYLLSYRGHMRMAVPESIDGSKLVREHPNSVSRPVGWKYLAQLGGTDVALGRKALLKCPHCNSHSARLPPGVEGAIVGKSLILSDVELRPFHIKSPWNEDAAHEHGIEAREAWMRERRTPLLDTPPTISKEAESSLEYALSLIPGDDSTFDYEVWTQVAHATDTLLRAAGGLSVAANAYACRWRSTRNPSTLTPAGVRVFEGLVGNAVLAYANVLASHGVRPLADRPPVRNRQKAYATVGDNPERTAGDLWEDLVKGRLVTYTCASGDLTEDLMESRLAYVPQKDVTNPANMKVR